MVKQILAYAKAGENEYDIYLYDDIEEDDRNWFTGEVIESETSASHMRKALDQMGHDARLNVHINSYGGSVKEGVAIYNLLKQHEGHVRVYVDGFACSIASVIAVAGDTVIMGVNALMMVHHAWTAVAGNPSELRKAADDLDVIDTAVSLAYLEKAGDKLTESKLKEIMDNETWLSAGDCVEYGLADQILNEQTKKAEEEMKAAAKLAMEAAATAAAPKAPDGEAKSNAERLMKAFKKKMEES